MSQPDEATAPAADVNVARAAKLDTATLSDALDKLGIAGQCHRIAPRSTESRLAGRACPMASPALSS